MTPSAAVARTCTQCTDSNSATSRVNVNARRAYQSAPVFRQLLLLDLCSRGLDGILAKIGACILSLFIDVDALFVIRVIVQSAHVALRTSGS